MPVTILSKYYTISQLQSVLNIPEVRAVELLNNNQAKLTVKELSVLLPKFKNPMQRLLTRKSKSDTGVTIPPDLHQFKLNVFDKRGHGVRVKFKAQSRQFRTVYPPDSSESILKSLFLYAEYHKNHKKSPLYKILRPENAEELAHTLSDSKVDYERLRHLFGDSYDLFKNLALKERRTLKQIYGVDPISVMSAVEVKVKSMDTIKDTDTDYIPFDKDDFAFTLYLKKVDPYHKAVKKDFLNLGSSLKGGSPTFFTTNFGQEIGIFINGECFLKSYRGTLPIDRPMIWQSSKRGFFTYPIFVDSIMDLTQTSTGTLIRVADGPDIESTLSIEAITEAIARPNFNKASKNFDGTCFFKTEFDDNANE